MSGLPLGEWPHPKASFIIPVNVPDADPGDAPLVCASWNKEYTPLILGACSQLMLESSLFSTHLTTATKLGKMNDLLSRVGGATPCSPVDVVHTRTFNFAASSDDWSIISGLYGDYVPDVGFVSKAWNWATGQWYSRLDMQFILPTAAPIRRIYLSAAEVDQTSWVGLPYTLDLYLSMYALSPAGIYDNGHSAYTMIPGYTRSPFDRDVNTVGTVTVASGKVEVHAQLRNFTFNPDTYGGGPLRLIIEAITLEWFEAS